jgi:hypothetical protein
LIQFQYKKKKDISKTRERVWLDFCFRYSTITTLTEKYGKSEKWVRNQLEEYVLPEKIFQSRRMVAIMDATKIGDEWYFVVRDPHTKENVYSAVVQFESTSSYQIAMYDLQKKGFDVVAVVGDGKVSVSWLFKGLPVQMCHFHMKQIIIRCITLNPILPAGIELLAVMNILTFSTEAEFTLKYTNWCTKWDTFLKEKTINPKTGRPVPTHRKLITARGSIKRHLPYLFTYLKYPELNIPNTTNSLDGSFKKIKTSIAVHAGLSRDRKLKMIKTLLNGL